MSTAAGPIMQHLEEQEVWRLVLASLAEAIYTHDFSLEAFLTQGDQYLIGFLNTLLGDFAAFASDGILADAEAYLESIGVRAAIGDAEMQTILEQAMVQASASAEGMASETSAAFSRWVAGLRAAGMSDDDIIAALRATPDQLAGVLGPWKSGLQDVGRQFVKIVDDLTYQWASERRAGGIPGKSAESYWVTVGDGKVCGQDDTSPARSCAARHGLVKTIDEWTRLGLPGSGVTYCRGRCRCFLVPKSYAASGTLADQLDATDALAAAKERAAGMQADVERYAKRRERAA